MRGSNGEYMQRAAAVDKYGVRFMDDLNNLRLPVAVTSMMQIPGYADGGLVGGSAHRASATAIATGPLRLHPDDLRALAAATSRAPINLTVHEANASAVDIVEEATFQARLGML